MDPVIQETLNQLKAEINSLKQWLQPQDADTETQRVPTDREIGDKDEIPMYDKSMFACGGLDEENPIAWLDLFEQAAERHGCSNAQKLKTVGTYLRDAANRWWRRNASTIDNWKRGNDAKDYELDCFYGAFFAQFVGPELLAHWNHLLRTSRQELTESSVQFLERLQDLVERVKHIHHVTESDIRITFFEGISKTLHTLITAEVGADANIATIRRVTRRQGHAHRSASNYAVIQPDLPKSPRKIIPAKHDLVRSEFMPTYHHYKPQQS
jgi:hypothetical protein